MFTSLEKSCLPSFKSGNNLLFDREPVASLIWVWLLLPGQGISFLPTTQPQNVCLDVHLQDRDTDDRLRCMGKTRPRNWIMFGPAKTTYRKRAGSNKAPYYIVSDTNFYRHDSRFNSFPLFLLMILKLQFKRKRKRSAISFLEGLKCKSMFLNGDWK